LTPVYVRTLTGREGALMEGEVGGELNRLFFTPHLDGTHEING